jgi:hypothetical protein
MIIAIIFASKAKIVKINKDTLEIKYYNYNNNKNFAIKKQIKW